MEQYSMEPYPHTQRGDVWLADLGQASGSEQGGIRPVAVIQNNSGNRHSPTVIVAAITGRPKKELPTHAALFKTPPGGSRGGGHRLRHDSTVLMEQIRTIDRARLLYWRALKFSINASQ